MKRGVRILLAAALVLLVSGCTSRGITVTSVPDGAEVSINYRVVGKTPIRVSILHYGTYRLELRKERYETLVREETISPPPYGYDPAAFVADNLVPARLNDEICLHFVLHSLEEKSDKADLSERDALLQRAELARSGAVTNPRTGEQLQIKLPSLPAESIAADSGEVNQGGAAASGSVPDKQRALPRVVPAISAKPPEVGHFAEEYNVPVEPLDKNRQASSLEEKRAADARALRPPKEEELIYAEPLPPDKEPPKTKQPEAVEKRP